MTATSRRSPRPRCSLAARPAGAVQHARSSMVTPIGAVWVAILSRPQRARPPIGCSTCRKRRCSTATDRSVLEVPLQQHALRGWSGGGACGGVAPRSCFHFDDGYPRARPRRRSTVIRPAASSSAKARWPAFRLTPNCSSSFVGIAAWSDRLRLTWYQTASAALVESGGRRNVTPTQLIGIAAMYCPPFRRRCSAHRRLVPSVGSSGIRSAGLIPYTM